MLVKHTSYASMYLYDSINTPSYTTSTTNMYKHHVPRDLPVDAGHQIVHSFQQDAQHSIDVHERDSLQNVRHLCGVGLGVVPSANQSHGKKTKTKNVSLDPTRRCSPPSKKRIDRLHSMQHLYLHRRTNIGSVPPQTTSTTTTYHTHRWYVLFHGTVLVFFGIPNVTDII
jgi:hypothetical protein